MQKYNLPSNHDLFQSRTEFDLLVEFWEDYYTQNPLEAHRNEDGHVQFKNTGDSLIDKWEEQIAQGMTPDMLEGFTPEQIANIQRLRKIGNSRTNPTQGLHSRSLKDVVDSVERPTKQPKFPSVFGNGSS